jgi:hypothetical protein
LVVFLSSPQQKIVVPFHRPNVRSYELTDVRLAQTDANFGETGVKSVETRAKSARTFVSFVRICGRVHRARNCVLIELRSDQIAVS